MRLRHGEFYAALQRIGWTLKKQVGSHRKMQRKDWQNFTFCFHDSEEVAPSALAKISKETFYACKIKVVEWLKETMR